MEPAAWQNYRGHIIVERRAGLFRRRRYEVWRAGAVIASFRDSIRAKVYVDGQLPE